MSSPLPTPPAPASAPSPAQPQRGKEKNVLGLIAFIVAAVGFIFACIPGALIVGWVLLPIAFILALVSLFFAGKSKTFGTIGLILSVVGTIVGVIVFLSVVATSFEEAFSGDETTAVAPAETSEDGEPAADNSAKDSATGVAAEEQGTRDNPYPIGTAITQGDWTVTINSVDLDATAQLTEANMFNDAPDAGTTYALINMTATYNGTDPDGESVWATLAYVTADGNTIDGTDKFLVAPESFDSLTTLYEGASVTGNKALQVPADTAGEGVLVVNPTMMGDKVYVAVK